MIYGRPLGIPHISLKSTIQTTLPKEIDDEFIAKDLEQPEGVYSINAFFLYNVKLYSVLDQILEKLNGALTNDANTTENSYISPEIADSRETRTLFSMTTTLQLDRMLLNWHGSLPEFLRFSLNKVEWPDNLSTQIQRQRNILCARFLGMRILLHRQSVLFLLEDPNNRMRPRNGISSWLPLFSDIPADFKPGSLPCERVDDEALSLETTLARLSARICVTSAQLQIEAIDCQRPLKVTGAWWWNFHCKLSSRGKSNT